MQHLEICLQTDYLPTTEALFSFQLSFKIIVFLYCCHKIKYNCCKFIFQFIKTELFIWFSSRKVSQRYPSLAAFVIVHAGS